MPFRCAVYSPCDISSQLEASIIAIKANLAARDCQNSVHDYYSLPEHVGVQLLPQGLRLPLEVKTRLEIEEPAPPRHE